MKVEIIEKKENPMLERQEIAFLVKEANATPSRKEIREQVAAHTNSDSKTLVVDVMETHYGSNELKGIARIYKDSKKMRKIELKYILTRNFGKEEEQAENKKAPAEKAEAKEEEPKAEAAEGKPKAEAEGKEDNNEEKKE